MVVYEILQDFWIPKITKFGAIRGLQETSQKYYLLPDDTDLEEVASPTFSKVKTQKFFLKKSSNFGYPMQLAFVSIGTPVIELLVPANLTSLALRPQWHRARKQCLLSALPDESAVFTEL